jgi:hypothetical protein
MMSTIGSVHPAIPRGELDDPSFMMLNLGRMTPLGSLIGRVVYGLVLRIAYERLAAQLTRCTSVPLAHADAGGERGPAHAGGSWRTRSSTASATEPDEGGRSVSPRARSRSTVRRSES